MQEQDKELFQDYEIKNWNFSPRLYKILGAAAIFNLLTLLVLGQTNLLTTKGCESPFVSTVCQVLDTVYVGSALFNTDTEFVSKDYEKTALEDADITYIDVSGQAPPLKYPEGYFALANPEEFAAMQNPTNDFSNFPTTIPGFPSNPTIGNGTDLLSKPQVVPTPNTNAITGNIPVLPYSISPNPVPPPNMTKGIKPRTFPNRPPKIKNNNSSPKELPKLEGETTAEKKDKKDEKKVDDKQPDLSSSPVDEDDKFNKKPLEDWGTKYGTRILSKEINVNAPFTVEVVAKLDENGKFINPKVTTTTGSDEKMTEAAKEAIAAFSDTKLLKPLYTVGGRNIKITFSQNQDNLQAIIITETDSESRAKTLLSGLNMYRKTFFNPKEGSDEAILMEKAQFARQGKNFIINFLIANDEKTQMIEKSLKGLQEKLKKIQTNGVEENTNANAKLSK